MKRTISMIMAILMAVGALFVVASCGGSKTYKYSSVEVKIEGLSDEVAALVGNIGEQMKPQIEESMKNAELIIEGEKVTMKDDKETKTLNCTKNGDRLEFSASNLKEVMDGIESGNVTAYIVEKDGATMNIEMQQSVLTVNLTIKLTIYFK